MNGVIDMRQHSYNYDIVHDSGRGDGKLEMLYIMIYLCLCSSFVIGLINPKLLHVHLDLSMYVFGCAIHVYRTN